MSKSRNCYSCAFFPICIDYLYDGVDKEMGCIDWTDEIKYSYVSSGTNCDKANLTVDTQYEIENLPSVCDSNIRKL